MKIGKMSKEKEPGKRGRMAEWTVAAVIFLLVLFLLLSGRISVSVTEEAVTMKGTYWKKKDGPCRGNPVGVLPGGLSDRKAGRRFWKLDASYGAVPE